jgi:electron transfer flavoprotein alpha subunit
MPEVLIVAEHADSHVSKPAFELLTLARRLGDPVAVVFGESDDTLGKALGEYGATRVLAVADPAIDDYLVAPKAEALAQIAANLQPVAILLTSTPEGKEIAGRHAVKLGSG